MSKNHVCNASCKQGETLRSEEGRLGRYLRHREGDKVWFEDIFIGPRAVYVHRDKCGAYAVDYAAPGLAPEYAEGPFAQDPWDVKGVLA
jgi:hypothetical protein